MKKILVFIQIFFLISCLFSTQAQARKKRSRSASKGPEITHQIGFDLGYSLGEITDSVGKGEEEGTPFEEKVDTESFTGYLAGLHFASYLTPQHRLKFATLLGKSSGKEKPQEDETEDDIYEITQESTHFLTSYDFILHLGPTFSITLGPTVGYSLFRITERKDSDGDVTKSESTYAEYIRDGLSFGGQAGVQFQFSPVVVSTEFRYLSFTGEYVYKVSSREITVKTKSQMQIMLGVAFAF